MFKTIKVFDKSAQVYEDWYKEPMGIQVLEAELQGIQALIPPIGLGAEIGAGTGIFAEQLTTEGRRIICVEPSKEMLVQAAQRDLQAILGVGEALPLRRECLDFAYLVTVLEFLSDPLVALNSIREALKAGTALVTLTINRGSSWGRFYTELAEKGDPIFRCAHLYDVDEVKIILEAAGYEPREALSTLTNPPDSDEVGVELAPTNPDAGVTLIKSIKK